MPAEQSAPTPAPSAESVWSRGSRSVAHACRETSLSRDELWELMDRGVIRWFPHGGQRRRILAWGDITDYLDGLHREHLAGANERDVL